MRVQFDTSAIPTRAAKRLKKQLSLKESVALAWTSYVLGYRDWHELLGQLGKAPPSPLDEALDATALAARRAYQLSRLTERMQEAGLIAAIPDGSQRLSQRQIETMRVVAEGLTTAQAAERLGISESTVSAHLNGARERLAAETRAEAMAKFEQMSGLPPIDPKTVLAAWKPSAGRPQENVAPADPNQRRGALMNSLSGLLILLYKDDGRHAAHLSLAEIEAAFLKAVPGEPSERTLRTAAEYPSDLMRTGDPVKQRAGRRMLEVLAARGVALAMANLGVSLLSGDGGPKDEKRAIDLFQRVLGDPEAPQQAKALANQLLGNAYARGLGQRGVDKAHAQALFEAGAAAGDATAAFNAGLFYDDHPALRQHGGQPDPAKAVRYFRQAAKGGVVQAATNLGMNLMTHKALAESPDEAQHWLRWAASQGDRNALRASLRLQP